MNIKTDIIDKLNPEIIQDMQRIWFTADLHHSHDKIISICGRPCSEKMHEEWLVNLINSNVKKKDVIYMIGDVSFARKPDADRFVDRLNGEKFLILGNHDKSLEKSTRFTQITQIKDFSYSKFGLNIHIVLCHYPMASWNRKPHGAWHLYGHVHGRFENTGLSIDVGIDNKKGFVGLDNDNHDSYNKPINLYSVVQIMARKEQLNQDKDNTEVSVDVE